MSVQKTDDPAVRATKNMTARRHGAGYGTILTEEENVDIIREAYAAREQAVRDFVECIKEDGSDMAFARDTQKAYERLRELYGL